jgi:hypothetical protein
MKLHEQIIQYVLIAAVFLLSLYVINLRFTEVEKARCTAWAWEVCQKINQ